MHVKFQIDLEHFQASFQAEPGGGRLLLAAERSNVIGCEVGHQVRALAPAQWHVLHLQSSLTRMLAQQRGLRQHAELDNHHVARALGTQPLALQISVTRSL